MPTDFISLFTACLIAACAPIIARIIPRGLVPETVILLLAGALLGPHMAGLIELTDSMNMISELGLAFLFLLPIGIARQEGPCHLGRFHGACVYGGVLLL